MERLAVAEAKDGDAMRTARLLGAAAKMREALGRRMDSWDQADWDGAVAAARLALGDAGYGVASAEGGAMTLDEATTYALSPLSAIPTRRRA